jgi:hypothetical protein
VIERCDSQGCKLVLPYLTRKLARPLTSTRNWLNLARNCLPLSSVTANGYKEDRMRIDAMLKQAGDA